MTPNIISTIAIMATVIFVVLYAAAFESLMALCLLAILPIVAFSATHPALLFSATIAVTLSNLKIPQAPPLLTVYHLLVIATIIAAIPHRILARASRRVRSPARKYLIGFCLVLLVTMYFRGAGIRVMGSQLWGGANYVTLLIGGAFFLSQDAVCLSPLAWRNTLIAMVLLSLLPFMAQLVYVGSHGMISQQYAFISSSGYISVTDSLDAVEKGEGVARFNTGFGVFLLFVPLIFFRNPFSGSKLLITLGFALLALICAAFSGSRSGILMILTFVVVWIVREGRARRWPKVLWVLTFALVIISVAALFGRHLPNSVQRAVSFVPFADISETVADDAGATVTWRIDLWEAAMRKVPRYWLLGRGLAFDSRELQIAISLGHYHRDWALITGSYHNAILSFLLNLGVFGLFFGTGFVVSVGLRHHRLSRATWSDSLLERIHHVLFAWFVSYSLLFFIAGGDVQTFGTVIFYAMLLEGVASTKVMMDMQSAKGHQTPAGSASIVQPTIVRPSARSLLSVCSMSTQISDEHGTTSEN